MVEENGSLSDRASELLQNNLKLQQSSYKDWLKEDIHLRSKYLLIQSFRKDEATLDNWKSRTFREEGDYDFYCYIQGPWSSLPSITSDDGFNILNKLIMAPCLINTRSLAVDIKIRIKLSFHSSFYIIPRVNGEINFNTPVVKVLKDANLRGLFVVFANINPLTHKFNFIKQNQVPENVGSNETSKELEVSFIDNGDDKVFINVSSFGKVQSIKTVNLFCPGFVPELNDWQIYFAGAGDSVFLKSVSIQYRDRIAHTPQVKRSAECVCCTF